ncbi:MAG: hypothetical protein CVT93_08580 [Bacteroidetes bacterium HGW-Bacteroidetes-10]|nr:MAG: hypothetical protein CVT93_08580 [Bacteroidetes bacterium HGW-Bacteroidetes-10]
MKSNFLRSVLFVFIFINTQNTLFSEEINIGFFQESINNGNNQSKAVLSTLTDCLFFLQNDTLRIVNLSNFEVLKSIKLRIPEQVHINDYVMLISADRLFFVNDHGGEVYQLSSDSLVRKDNSYSHKMQIASNTFIFNGTIYRYGGYGFWSARNIITFFDITSRNWEILQPVGSAEIPVGNYDGFLFQTDSVWYFFGGKYIDPRFPLEPKKYNQIWEFNIKKLKWTKLGDYTPSSFVISKTVKYRNRALIVAKDKFLLLDIVANNVSVYENSFIDDNLKHIFFHKGYFYLIESKSSDKEYVLSKIDENDFLGKLVDEKPFYKNESNNLLKWVLISSIFLLIVIFVYHFKFRNKGRIRVESKSLALGDVTIDISEEMCIVLKILLKNDEVSTGTLLDSIKKENLHPTQNLRILHNLICELNLKLMLLTKSDLDIISVIKSDTDKRIKVYKIDKTYFDF